MLFHAAGPRGWTGGMGDADYLHQKEKQSMIKTELRRAKQSLARLKKLEARLAKLRDEYREEFYDLEGILESIDSGLEGITEGSQMLKRGIDDISKYV